MTNPHNNPVIQGLNAIHNYVFLAAFVYTLALLGVGYWFMFVGHVVGIGVDTNGEGSGVISLFGWSVMTIAAFFLSFSLCSVDLATSQYFKLQIEHNVDKLDGGTDGYRYIEDESFCMRALVLAVIVVFLMLMVGRITQYWGGWMDLAASWGMMLFAGFVYTYKPQMIAERALVVHKEGIQRINRIVAANHVAYEEERTEKKAKKAAKKERKRLKKEHNTPSWDNLKKA